MTTFSKGISMDEWVKSESSSLSGMRVCQVWAGSAVHVCTVGFLVLSMFAPLDFWYSGCVFHCCTGMHEWLLDMNLGWLNIMLCKVYFVLSSVQPIKKRIKYCPWYMWCLLYNTGEWVAWGCVEWVAWGCVGESPVPRLLYNLITAAVGNQSIRYHLHNQGWLQGISNTLWLLAIHLMVLFFPLVVVDVLLIFLRFFPPVWFP